MMEHDMIGTLDTAVGAKRETQVPAQLKDLSDAIDGYGELLRNLRDRLDGVVLTRDLPPKPEITKPKPALVPLALAINEAGGRLDILNYDLEGLIERLEL